LQRIKYKEEPLAIVINSRGKTLKIKIKFCAYCAEKEKL
jgi:hypothetical protein